MSYEMIVERYTDSAECTIWNASPEDRLDQSATRGFAKPLGGTTAGTARAAASWDTSVLRPAGAL